MSKDLLNKYFTFSVVHTGTYEEPTYYYRIDNCTLDKNKTYELKEYNDWSLTYMDDHWCIYSFSIDGSLQGKLQQNFSQNILYKVSDFINRLKNQLEQNGEKQSVWHEELNEEEMKLINKHREKNVKKEKLNQLIENYSKIIKEMNTLLGEIDYKEYQEYLNREELKAPNFFMKLGD